MKWHPGVLKWLAQEEEFLLISNFTVSVGHRNHHIICKCTIRMQIYANYCHTRPCEWYLFIHYAQINTKQEQPSHVINATIIISLDNQPSNFHSSIMMIIGTAADGCTVPVYYQHTNRTPILWQYFILYVTMSFCSVKKIRLLK